MLNPMLAMPGGAEWLIILAIVILVFGAAKLPELARGSGQALRIFKSETKGLRDDDDEAKAAEAADEAQATPAHELPSSGAEEPTPVAERPLPQQTPRDGV